MALVEVSNLTKSFGKVTAVNDVSFSIEEGRCTALLGPNGAGKSTTLNMLAGLLRPTSGSIQFDGVKRHADRRGVIGYLPQNVALPGWMTGREFLVLVGELFGETRKQAKIRATDLLGVLGLSDAGGRRIGGYSGGMKQRLGLAQALVRHPKLLILDEPVTGLDPVGRREVLELLKLLKGESTILFSTHVLPDAEEISDDVMIISRGEIAVAEQLPALRERYEQPIVEVEFETEQAVRQWMGSISRAIGATAETRGNVVRFRFGTIESMRNGAARIYEFVAEQSVPARRVELGQTTLEDLFLTVVGQ